MILDQDYRLLSAVSNSSQKDFMKHGPHFYYENYVAEERPERREFSTESTDIGDLVDCLITQKAAFNTFYYISGDVKVSPDFRKVLDNGWNLALTFLLNEKKMPEEKALLHPFLQKAEEAMPFLLAAARNVVLTDPSGVEKVGYRNNYKDEALSKYILEDGGSYYSDKGAAGGRKILDQTTYNVAMKCADSILKHDTIGKMWQVTNKKGKQELFGQLMVTVEINGVLCKILLDYTLFDHVNKIIYPKDVKSARSHRQFMENYVNFDYPNQGSFYSGVLKAKYPDYKIAPFEFVVGCTDSGEDPMVYRMSETELTVARDGAQLKSGKTIRGWMNVVNQIRWHYDNDLWRYPKEFYDNGYIMLNTYNDDSIEAAGEDVGDIF
jgi:hypothetical protein